MERQLSNILLPILVMPLGIVIDVREVQYLNACILMLVTLLGNVIDFSE